MPKAKKHQATEEDLVRELDELGREFNHLIMKGNKMAKAKTQVKTIADKLSKVNESFTINMYDNGFMIEIGGRDSEEEWKTAKIMCGSIEEILGLVREACEMERDS